MGAFDQVETERPECFPHGKIVGPDILIIPFFSGVKVLILMSVNEKSVVGADRSLLQQKRIKSLTSEKLSHKLFDICYFQCDHMILRLYMYILWRYFLIIQERAGTSKAWAFSPSMDNLTIAAVLPSRFKL